jgi:release factor glutamine methyltransferase
MFVKENSVKAIKDYFKNELSSIYHYKEINNFTKQSICERFNWTATDYILGDEQRLSESDLLFFRGIVKILLNHEPFQYIMGKVSFFGLEFRIDQRALVPRPETEELVRWITEEINLEKPFKVLDVCTGSGCIALAMQSLANQARVIGVDKSTDALALARENAAFLSMRVDFFQMDALDKNQYEVFSENDFDCWVSNPPYIPESEFDSLPENVLRHEPHLALFVSNENPIIFYTFIAREALRCLKTAAWLFYEVHENLAEQVVRQLHELGFVNIELRKDLQGKNRLLKAQKP